MSFPGRRGANEVFIITGNLTVTLIQGGFTMILFPERAHVCLDHYTIYGPTAESKTELLREGIEQSEMPG